MGRKMELEFIDADLLNASTALRTLRGLDVKARKSKTKARLKPKYTTDIDRIDLLIETIVISRKILKGLPKAVQ